jgi:hypothetical protein
MKTIKQVRRTRDIRRVTPDGRVYILRKRIRPFRQKLFNLKMSDAKMMEVQR